MKQKEPEFEEHILKENKRLKTILVIFGIVLLIGCTIGSTIAFINRKTIAVKLASFLMGEQTSKNEQLMPSSQPSDQIVTTTTKTPTQMDAYRSRAVEYINCNHEYSVSYPKEWSHNGITNQSDIVELYGPNITGRITALYNSSLLTDETLYALANDRLKGTKGIQIGSRDKQRNGVHILAYDFKNPRSLFVLWQRGNYQMEMRFWGAWDQTQEDNLGYLLATFNPNDTNNSLCQYGQPSVVPAVKINTSQTCSHPNGDVEFWWNDVSQEIRDCYIAQYGWPAFTLPDSNQGDAGVPDEPCSFPNGEVELWWNAVSQSIRDCFISQGGIPPR